VRDRGGEKMKAEEERWVGVFVLWSIFSLLLGFFFSFY
jgi:hypothetical protein